MVVESVAHLPCIDCVTWKRTATSQNQQQCAREHLCPIIRLCCVFVCACVCFLPIETTLYISFSFRDISLDYSSNQAVLGQTAFKLDFKKLISPDFGLQESPDQSQPIRIQEKQLWPAILRLPHVCPPQVTANPARSLPYSSLTTATFAWGWLPPSSSIRAFSLFRSLIPF